MFTGIVEEVGRVLRLDARGRRARLEVACSAVLPDTAPGGSLAVEGCCLTVTQRSTDRFTADLMAETLAVTTLGGLRPGDPVNLERPVPAGGRLGGHLVQGHVDGVCEVSDRREEPGTVWVSLTAPAALARYLVPRGSVAVAGVSLTVVAAEETGGGDGDRDGVTIRVALIPHTLAATTLGGLRPGDAANLEVDVVAKYVERLLAAGAGSPYSDLPRTGVAR